MIEQQQFPPILSIGELSVLIKKSPGSILADRCRAPHLLPPDCTPPGSRQPLWLLADVLTWLEGFRASANTPRKRGRPTKVEQIARREKEQQPHTN